MTWPRLTCLFAAALVAAAAWAGDSNEPKVLRLAFRTAETSFDPAKINDIYSIAVTAHIFEAPCAYDYLAKPARIRPRLAVGMPEASADFKTWTVTLRPGVYFADDPAFKGKQREVVAQDLVYAFQRVATRPTRAPTGA